MSIRARIARWYGMLRGNGAEPTRPEPRVADREKVRAISRKIRERDRELLRRLAR